MRFLLLLGAAGLVANLLLSTGCTTLKAPKTGGHPKYSLKIEQVWSLEAPAGERFDASGLLLSPDGELLTVNDRGATLFHILLNTNSVAKLVPWESAFTSKQLSLLSREKTDRYDCEGIARDEAGRIYVCEEANRWVLRYDPAKQTVERLSIDWSPVSQFFGADRNASFEGIAVGVGRMYVANERGSGRIIVVDLETFRVVDDFVVHPSRRGSGEVTYSDLSWFENSLFVLLRKDQVVLKVDPTNHRVLAEYDYRTVETAAATRYLTIVNFGLMEGLAVDRDYFWLVIDNNGLSRQSTWSDTPATLFKCRRPDSQL